MSNYKNNIINCKFNKLTVISKAHRRQTGEQLFYCDCDCGTKNHLVSKHQLISGKLKSCGCLKKDTEDMAGKKFTRLTVIKRLENEYGYKKQPLFLCKCSCGNTIKTIKSKLVNNYTKSCGCLLEEINTKYKDLVNQQFGRLLVTKKLGKISMRRDIFWECLCECGKSISVTTGNLVHGHVKSCGCISRDTIRAYRISIGKNPDIPIKTARQLLRSRIKKLKLDKQAFIRDNYTCQLCGIVGHKLNAHHIIPIYIDENKALDIKNMITLCKKCHFERAHCSNYKKIDINLQNTFIKQMALL